MAISGSERRGTRKGALEMSGANAEGEKNLKFRNKEFGVKRVVLITNSLGVFSSCSCADIGERFLAIGESFSRWPWMYAKLQGKM